MDPDARIFVAGSGTMTGRALVGGLTAQGFSRLVGLNPFEPDLRDPSAVDRFFADARPEYVFVAAGKHAGIGGNQTHPVDLMIDNLLIAGSVIPAAWRHGATKLLYLASSCTYPKLAPQPFRPDSLWTGPLEPTSKAYSVAKLTGMTLVDAYRRQHGILFINAIGADTFGPGDDFSPDNSHVVGALIRRMSEAREKKAPVVDIWGTGSPRREFIYVDDLANACIFAMRRYEGTEPINLGTSVTTSIAELAVAVRDVVGYQGKLTFDTSRPDGMPLKGLDSSVLAGLGWKPKFTLRAGLERTCQWFAAHSFEATHT